MAIDAANSLLNIIHNYSYMFPESLEKIKIIEKSLAGIILHLTAFKYLADEKKNETLNLLFDELKVIADKKEYFEKLRLEELDISNLDK